MVVLVLSYDRHKKRTYLRDRVTLQLPSSERVVGKKVAATAHFKHVDGVVRILLPI